MWFLYLFEVLARSGSKPGMKLLSVAQVGMYRVFLTDSKLTALNKIGMRSTGKSPRVSRTAGGDARPLVVA